MKALLTLFTFGILITGYTQDLNINSITEDKQKQKLLKNGGSFTIDFSFMSIGITSDDLLVDPMPMSLPNTWLFNIFTHFATFPNMDAEAAFADYILTNELMIGDDLSRFNDYSANLVGAKLGYHLNLNDRMRIGLYGGYYTGGNEEAPTESAPVNYGYNYSFGDEYVSLNQFSSASKTSNQSYGFDFEYLFMIDKKIKPSAGLGLSYNSFIFNIQESVVERYGGNLNAEGLAYGGGQNDYSFTGKQNISSIFLNPKIGVTYDLNPKIALNMCFSYGISMNTRLNYEETITAIVSNNSYDPTYEASYSSSATIKSNNINVNLGLRFNL